jgi:hypothetical protein
LGSGAQILRIKTFRETSVDRFEQENGLEVRIVDGM